MRHKQDSFDDQVGRLAALGEPVRRALYRYVVGQPGAVGREEAAAAVGVAHHTAKFHLDKLETEGLLDTEFSRPPGRTGPGAGRPAKRYRRAGRGVSVSLPARRYDLAGHVMAEAISSASGSGAPVAEALRDAAIAAGRELGGQARARTGRRTGRSSATGAVSEVLAGCGYEPRDDDGTITLANCPFHDLAADYPDLVCGMNIDLVGGVLECATEAKLRARLDPAEGRCCVVLEPDT